MASLTMGPCISAHGRQQKFSNCWSSGLSALTLHVLDSVCVCVWQRRNIQADACAEAHANMYRIYRSLRASNQTHNKQSEQTRRLGRLVHGWQDKTA